MLRVTAGASGAADTSTAPSGRLAGHPARKVGPHAPQDKLYDQRNCVRFSRHSLRDATGGRTTPATTAATSCSSNRLCACGCKCSTNQRTQQIPALQGSRSNPCRSIEKIGLHSNRPTNGADDMRAGICEARVRQTFANRLDLPQEPAGHQLELWRLHWGAQIQNGRMRDSGRGPRQMFGAMSRSGIATTLRYWAWPAPVTRPARAPRASARGTPAMSAS